MAPESAISGTPPERLSRLCAGFAANSLCTEHAVLVQITSGRNDQTLTRRVIDLPQVVQCQRTSALATRVGILEVRALIG